MSDHRLDAVIVGAGQGGVPLAVNLARAGWSVALVERTHLGGTCVNTGCTPTKTMLASARAAHVARTGGELGVRTRGVEVDLARVVERKDELVGSFRRGLRERVDVEGLELVRGDARFVGPGALEVVPPDRAPDGVDASELVGEPRRLEADRVVLDVGQRPSVPPIPGLDETPYLTEEGLMALEEVPEALVVVGGGYVGCEFAQMFARFGSDVTLLQVEDQLMPREDADVAAEVEEAFGDEGIRVLTGTPATAVEGGEGSVEVEAEGDDGTLRVEGSHLLVAAGRRPNTDGLELEVAGVETDDRGYIPVDAVFRTSAEGVWAIGDCNGLSPFTNVSYHDFQILYENWVNGASLTREGRNVTYALYTDPPLAGVGLNEREAREQGVDYRVATTPMRHVARALETGETRGLMKVLAEPGSRRILGASMVGIGADEVIHVVTAVMDAGAPWDVLANAVFAHPAVAEALPVLVRKLEEGEGYA